MSAVVVILTKLPDHLPVKTRLVPLLGEQGARDFYRECLRRTIALAHAITARVRIAYSPAEAAAPGPGYVPVAGDDGATCLENALADAYAADGGPLIALGGDAPDLPAARLDEVVASLREHEAVLVPTGDGGFSCLGLRAPVAGLANAFVYGGGDAYVSLRSFLHGHGMSVHETEPWPDIDTPAQYLAYVERSRDR